jgi:hypothetical protein
MCQKSWRKDRDKKEVERNTDKQERDGEAGNVETERGAWLPKLDPTFHFAQASPPSSSHKAPPLQFTIHITAWSLLLSLNLLLCVFLPYMTTLSP